LDLVVDMQDGLQRTATGRAMLNPARAVITAAGVSTPDGDMLYDGPESDILRQLDRHFASLDPGIIATWSGSTLDLPLLEARATSLSLSVGLRVQPDRRRSLRLVDADHPEPTLAVGSDPGQERRPVLGAWHRQRHLDLRWLGTRRNHPSAPAPLDDPCRHAYAARSAADQRWARARRHLERMPSPDVLIDAVWAPFDDLHLSDRDLDDLADDFADDFTTPIREVPQEAVRRHPSAGARVGI
jgi:hypothetical protein